jgi:nicotinamidase-related amidase
MVQAATNGRSYGPFGEEPVLLVIDVQNGVVKDAWDRDGVLDRLTTLIGRARADGVPVVYVQHESEELQPGTVQWKIHDRIAPADGESIIAKRYGDAFIETALPETLAKLGAGHLYIAGAQTDACIRATTHRAMGLGYDVTLVSDCHTTDDFDWDGVRVSAEQLVGHFNLAIRYSEYPGQVIRAVPHTEIH